MKCVIIYEPNLNGHRLEYIYHIYTRAIKCKENKYVFCIPQDYESIDVNLNWEISENVIIDIIAPLPKKNRYIFGYQLCLGLKNKVITHNADEVFLISLMDYMPYLVLFFNFKIKISGIIYLIYLYRWNDANLIKKTEDVLKYILFSKTKIFHQIFLLNDEISPRYLNRLYKTNVFKYLPDPFFKNMALDFATRENLGIEKGKKIFLHFGGLSNRKGSLEILKAINLIEEREKFCFIFAGRVYDSIKYEFYEEMQRAKEKSQIILFDKFCTYEFISSLCAITDVILIPYKATAQSSGVLGYAAYYNKPVVGPSSGLLGRIIKKYRLGLTIHAITPHNILNSIMNDSLFKVQHKQPWKYLEDNSIDNFLKKIFIILP